MRFIEFLTEGIAKKTYRKHRVSPGDAAWAKREFKQVDAKGHHAWITHSENPKTKTINRKKEGAIIDRARTYEDKYKWAYDHTPTGILQATPFAGERAGPEQAKDMFIIVWKEQDMDRVDL